MPAVSIQTRPAFGANERDFAGGTMLARNATMLVVEDSRYACEVLRLYCRQLGIRLRRAADIATAQAHLRLYLPDILIIDLGLPDGRGEDLIAEIITNGHRPSLIMAISGDDSARPAALAAGADVFMETPLPDLVDFRAFLVDHFPAPLPLALLPNRPFRPETDILSLRDDLTLAADGLAGGAPQSLPYIKSFISGLAVSAGDAKLSAAADIMPTDGGFRRLRDIVNERLRDMDGRI